jgi:TRAP-type C4-dicarboxylate transport system permease small subunit
MTHSRLETALVRILRSLVGSLMLSAVAINFANVIGRYLFGRPFIWAEEVMQFMNIWAVMLGAAIITFNGTHLRMDAFYQMVPRGVRRLLDALTSLLAIVVSGYIIYQSVQMVGMLSATGQRSVIARVPMNLMYLAVPLGFACTILFLVLWLYRLCRGREPAPEATGPGERPEVIA